MLTLWLLRHAATEWNEQARMQGRRDIALGESGRAELARWQLPDRVCGRVEWVSSPLSRATETAAHFAGDSVRVEPALIEMDWGDWEGYRLDALRDRLGTDFTDNEQRGLDFRPPRGESPRDVIARVIPWLDALADDRMTVAAVTHNGVLRPLMALATGWDMTRKAPVKLRAATMHRFAYARGRNLRLCESNVPLVQPVSGARCVPPPAPSGAFR